MEPLKQSEQHAQETLRRLLRPLRITDTTWTPAKGEAHYLQKKYEEYGLEYSQRVNKLRREWDSDQLNFRDMTYREYHHELGESVEVALLTYKFWENYKWAREKDNKYLLAEDIDGFPCMNYILKEGPYTPPLDAQFGLEDFHLILESFSGNLIFLQPRLYGFTSGKYVETDL